MSEIPDSYAGWIIGTLLTALGATVTAFIGLGKFLGMKFAADILEFKTKIAQLEIKSDECEADRLSLNRRIGQLEGSTIKNESRTNSLEIESRKRTGRIKDLEDRSDHS